MRRNMTVFNPPWRTAFRMSVYLVALGFVNHYMLVSFSKARMGP